MVKPEKIVLSAVRGLLSDGTLKPFHLQERIIKEVTKLLKKTKVDLNCVDDRMIYLTFLGVLNENKGER